MYADRFEKRRVDPGSMAVAIGINAVVVGALIFSAPEVFRRLDPPPLITTNIPVDVPPPPESHPRTKPQHDARQPVPDPRPANPDPKVPSNPDDGLKVDPGTTGGTGNGTLPLDPPKPPAPVLTDASPDPRFARDFQPTYPPAARRAGQEGRVTVRVLVGVDGRVKAVEAVSGDNDDFLNATRRQAFAHWRFRPATRDGIPYEAWRVMSVRFQLND